MANIGNQSRFLEVDASNVTKHPVQWKTTGTKKLCMLAFFYKTKFTFFYHLGKDSPFDFISLLSGKSIQDVKGMVKKKRQFCHHV